MQPIPDLLSHDGPLEQPKAALHSFATYPPSGDVAPKVIDPEGRIGSWTFPKGTSASWEVNYVLGLPPDKTQRIRIYAPQPRTMEKKTMSFNWKQFLVNLAALAPTLVAGTAALAGEASTATKTQLATDSANLATGVSQVLLTGNEEEQAVAGFASQITKSIITATSQAHAALGLPTLHADTNATNQAPAAPANTAQNTATAGQNLAPQPAAGFAKQVG